jgi:hypothetical protein
LSYSRGTLLPDYYGPKSNLPANFIPDIGLVRSHKSVSSTSIDNPDAYADLNSCPSLPSPAYHSPVLTPRSDLLSAERGGKLGGDEDLDHLQRVRWTA